MDQSYEHWMEQPGSQLLVFDRLELRALLGLAAMQEDNQTNTRQLPSLSRSGNLPPGLKTNTPQNPTFSPRLKTARNTRKITIAEEFPNGRPIAAGNTVHEDKECLTYTLHTRGNK